VAIIDLALERLLFFHESLIIFSFSIVVKVPRSFGDGDFIADLIVGISPLVNDLRAHVLVGAPLTRQDLGRWLEMTGSEDIMPAGKITARGSDVSETELPKA